MSAAEIFEARGDKHTAEFLRTYADFLESHIEKWTVTNQGSLVPGIRRHYIRINPAVSSEGARGDEDPDSGELVIANQRPGDRATYPANEIVDAGFLELVRFGIRPPGDPLIEDSLKVVDAVLKVDTPFGPCWSRYNHDGYGQRADGTSFKKWGVGHAWPLLTLERATYELSAGRNIDVYLRAAEAFATGVGLFPEQIWDAPDIPEEHMFFGKATGAAIPLMWAHAEYVKILRSVVDNKVYDHIDPVSRALRQQPGRVRQSKYGRSIARFAKSRPEHCCASWHHRRSCCIGVTTSGTPRATPARSRPRSRWSMSIWKSMLRKKRHCDSLFTGRSIINGKAMIMRSKSNNQHTQMQPPERR